MGAVRLATQRRGAGVCRAHTSLPHVPAAPPVQWRMRMAWRALSVLRGAAQPPSNACDGVDLPEHLEAQGHPGRPARWLAPGSTFTQSG